MGALDPNRLSELDDPVLPEPEPLESAPAPNNRDLGAIEVSSELASLFSTAKVLLDQVITDDDVPANQRAQVLNSVTAILERVAKVRTDLYSAERVQRIEQIVVRLMKEQPMDVREAFLKQYEALLAG